MVTSRTKTTCECSVSTYAVRSLEEKLEWLLLVNVLKVICLIKLSMNWHVDGIFFGNIMINVFVTFQFSVYTTELVA